MIAYKYFPPAALPWAAAYMRPLLCDSSRLRSFLLSVIATAVHEPYLEGSQPP